MKGKKRQRSKAWGAKKARKDVGVVKIEALAQAAVAAAVETWPGVSHPDTKADRKVAVEWLRSLASDGALAAEGALSFGADVLGCLGDDTDARPWTLLVVSATHAPPHLLSHVLALAAHRAVPVLSFPDVLAATAALRDAWTKRTGAAQAASASVAASTAAEASALPFCVAVRHPAACLAKEVAALLRT
eukprot:Rhum_TRINITY_DN19080_c0_g1::Rhum_TRINITY_DN19080_c0_g1_i1::g.169199::m.169199